MTKKALHFHFLLLDGFSNMVLACAMEPLRATCHLFPHLDLHWSFAPFFGQSATSSSGLALAPLQDTMQPEDPHRLHNHYDYLIVVAGYHARHVDRMALTRTLQPEARRAHTLVGLDMGAWLLAMAGFLDGYKATLHWDELDDFEEAFLDVELVRSRFCMDRNRLTAGGASSTMSLILDILAEEFGPAVAMDVRNLFVYDNNPIHPGQNSMNSEQQSSQDNAIFFDHRISDPLIKQALAFMKSNMEDPLTLDQLSQQLGLSKRGLDRHFNRVLGLSPMQYYLIMRLSVARNLAQETRLAIADIAVKSGFSSASALSRAFSRQFGRPIKTMRQTSPTRRL